MLRLLRIVVSTRRLPEERAAQRLLVMRLAFFVSAYILAILTHYPLLFGRQRKGHRENPEPAERLLVLATAIASRDRL